MNANLSAGPIPVSVAPEVLADIQAEFSREWQRLCDDARRGALAPPSDRRFSGDAWAANASHLLLAHTYLLSARAMQRMVDAAQVSEPMRDRLRFSIMQWTPLEPFTVWVTRRSAASEQST